MNIARLNPELLNEEHKLYEILRKESPIWWKIVESDTELYIEIRKKNIIDVYYKGGRMAEIKLTKNTQIELTAHPKYLGHEDKYDPRYYRRREKEGKMCYDPIYQDCTKWIEYKMAEFKSNIRKHYAGEENGENTSEKLIQGKLIIKNKDKHLDSEFAHRFEVGSRKTIRIDLVKIVDNKITFVELKRIVDARLRTTDGKPEILTQMNDYRLFLEHNKKELITYYKHLYKIKKRLGLPVPAVDDVEKLTIDTTPQLIIHQNYDSISNGRSERVADIEQVLKSNSIAYNIF